MKVTFMKRDAYSDVEKINFDSKGGVHLLKQIGDKLEVIKTLDLDQLVSIEPDVSEKKN